MICFWSLLRDRGSVIVRQYQKHGCIPDQAKEAEQWSKAGRQRCQEPGI